MKSQVWDAVVIGGGHNGLVTAAYLARGGLRVLVLERREILGGACVTEETFPGFRVSTASYLCSLLSSRIISELDLRAHGYQVYAKDPTFFTPFPDGRHLLMWQNQEKTCEEIAKFSMRDAVQYPKYEAFIEHLASFVDPLLLKPAPNLHDPALKDLAGLAGLGWGLAQLPGQVRVGLMRIFTQSVADFLDTWFESEQLKVTLATDGVIGVNGGPRSAGTAYVLLHHLMGSLNGQRGVWGFVRGGMGTVAKALAAAAQGVGATIRSGVEVKHIQTRNGRANGVVLRSGEEIRARLVVSNLDPKRTFLDLVEPKALNQEFLQQIGDIRMKGSSMKINLALDDLPSFKVLPGSDLMSHHKATIHICPDIEYLERAWDDAKYGRPSDRPFLEITIPTTYDDSLAPPGKHIMGVFLQYTPYDLKDTDWADVKEQYADHVMDLIEEQAPGFKSLILHRQVLSPLDLEETFGLTGGNIFHGDMSLDQLFSLRPLPGWTGYRAPVKNLYLCGSGTHPGGGVMGAPGYNAARAILADQR